MSHPVHDRHSLNEGHPVLQARDDRAIELGRKTIEKPRDRRKGKATKAKKDSYEPLEYIMYKGRMVKIRKDQYYRYNFIPLDPVYSPRPIGAVHHSTRPRGNLMDGAE